VRRLTTADRLTRPADTAGLAARPRPGAGASGSALLRPLALVGAAACWGAGTVVSKQAVAELAPITLLAVQLGVSVAVLLGLAVARRESLPAGRDGRLLGRLGLLNPGIAYALSLIGLTQISASLSVILWATEPILIVLLASVVLGERVGRGFVVATAVALAGLVLVVFDPAATGALPGVALTVAGVGVCAVYTVAARRWLPGTPDSTFGVVLAQQVHALGLVLVIVVGLGAVGQAVVPTQLTIVGAASAAASGLLYYSLAYLCYLFALRSIPASVAAASFYLVPVFGVALASVVGERLAPVQWLGAAIVVAAVAAITLRGTRTPRPSLA
jgi:drug/metabolite transporter (DMT)-like permease